MFLIFNSRAKFYSFRIKFEKLKAVHINGHISTFLQACE